MSEFDIEAFRPLEDSLMTPEGWQAVADFITEPSSNVIVVNNAFTEECAEILRACPDALFSSVSPLPESLHNLAHFLSQAVVAGQEPISYVRGSWKANKESIRPHFDMNAGNAVLGYFDIEGSPRMYIFDRPTEEEVWEMHDQMFTLPISHQDPRPIVMRNGQLVIIPGDSTIATPLEDDGSMFTNKMPTECSFPHEVVVDQGDARNRLFFYGSRQQDFGTLSF